MTIPCPILLKTEMTDETHAKVYGSFWVLNYVRRGEVLHCISGGEFPGIALLEKTGDEWRVTDMETAGDGEDYAADIGRFANGDAELEEKIEEYRQAFVAYITREACGRVDEGDIDSAAELIEESLQLLECEEFTELLAQVQDADDRTEPEVVFKLFDEAIRIGRAGSYTVVLEEQKKEESPGAGGTVFRDTLLPLAAMRGNYDKSRFREKQKENRETGPQTHVRRNNGFERIPTRILEMMQLYEYRSSSFGNKCRNFVR